MTSRLTPLSWFLIVLSVVTLAVFGVPHLVNAMRIAGWLKF